MMLGFNIIQSILSILEIRFCVWLMEKLALPRFTGIKQRILVWIAAGIGGGSYAVSRWISVYYSWIASLIVLGELVLFSALIFREDRGVAIFIASNFLFIGGLLDLVLMSAVEIVLPNTGMRIYVEDVNSGCRITVMLISKGLLWATFFLIQKIFEQEVLPELKKTSIRILCIVFCAVEYITVTLFFEPFFNKKTMPYGFCGILWLYCALTLLALGLFCSLINYLSQKNQIKLQEIQLDQMNYDYQKMMDLYISRAAVYHDMKNHFIVLKEMMQSGEWKRVENYLERISRPFWQNDSSIRTGHVILDLILNCKIREAKEEDIHVNYNVIGRAESELKLTDVEICALMGNLWDNAIEACRKVEKSKRNITFSLKIQHNMIACEMKNPCTDIRTDEKGKLLTTKDDTTMHGIGMRTIQRILERHEGEIEYGTKEGEFWLRFMMFDA